MVNLNFANLTGADLADAELADARIDGVDFTRADLADANLTRAQLNGANLTSAKLVGANLTRAQLNGANLTRAQLNGANLTSARVTRANLTSADLTSARLVDAWLPGVDFTRADLDSATLTGANLAEVTLTDANLTFADLTGANLTGANLTGANLSSVYLTNAVWPPDVAVPEGWQRDSGSGRLAGIPSAPVKVAGLPGSVRQYLFPAEGIVAAVRLHPIVLFVPVTLILAGALFAGFVTKAAPPGDAIFVQIVWPLWIVLAAWQGWKIAIWWQTYFVVTDRRMVLISGLLNRKVDMIPLAKITDLSFFPSRLGRALGYAEFIVESAGQEQALSRLAFVPHPGQLYQEIIAVVFSDDPAS